MNEKEQLRAHFNFVRAAAILGIFFFHIYDYSFGGFGSVGARMKKGILPSLFAGAESFQDYLWGAAQLFMSMGDKGVELFLVASGFGLYLSYLEKRPSWFEFYKRRVLRVLPLYWAACIVIYLLFPVTLRHLLLNVFLVQIFTKDFIVFGAMWFIGYLFLMYLLFPLFVLAFKNEYVKWGLFAASFFLTPLWNDLVRLLGFTPVGVAPTAYWQVFLLGMIIAESLHNGRTVHRCLLNPSVGALAAVFLAAVLYLVSYQVPYSAFMQRLMAVLIFLSLSMFMPLFGRSRVLGKAAGRLAYASYAIFLTHMIVFLKALMLADKKKWIWKFLVYPRFVFPLSHLKFIYTVLVLLAVTLVVSFAVQWAYDLIVRRTGRLLSGGQTVSS
jgi:peptidoglycan/LPS O-acetylase OafA/YrhL